MTWFDKNKTCHDCGAPVGYIHELGCDMETCPKCKGQLISCGCFSRTNGDWKATIRSVERIPYLVSPVLCEMCGTLWPDMFHVSDQEWKQTIPPHLQRAVICRSCYDLIRALWASLHVTGWQHAPHWRLP
jgi:hypothetical protein